MIKRDNQEILGSDPWIHVAPLQRSSNLSPSTVTLEVCVREITMFYRLSFALVGRVGGQGATCTYNLMTEPVFDKMYKGKLELLKTDRKV